MTDETLQQLLQAADSWHQAADQSTSPTDRGMSIVAAVRRRRAQKVRRRTGFGVVAVLVIVGGLSAWTLNARPWNGDWRVSDSIASNSDIEPDETETTTSRDGAASNSGGGARGRLQPGEIARLRAEIAALDAEAIRAQRLVDHYRAADARRERLVALESSSAEPLLSPESLAALAIDRAAAITVTSADAQASQFNSPADAAESYRSVLTLFPSSRWAGVARQRLEAMEHMN
jgi:hypothetical protein